MKVIDEIKRNWRECFPEDSPEYIDMFFRQVYRDEDAMYIVDSGKVVSSLLLQHYGMQFHGSVVPVDYVAGACTRRQARGKGYMGSLIRQALGESARRGSLFTMLIPAEDWLYYYYDKFGFSRSILCDIERYTALHSFEGGERYTVVSPDNDRLYEAMRDMEESRPGSIVHSRQDLENILSDNIMDGGMNVVVSPSDNPTAIAAIAFACERNSVILVKQILYTEPSAGEAALHRLRQAYPERPFKVIAPVDEGRRPSVRGMIRAVDVDSILKAIAAAYPQWRCRIKVSDPILDFNNGVWRIGGGEVVMLPDGQSYPSVDLDVDVTTFTSIIFSSRHVGEIMKIPTTRPNIFLTLD